MSKNELTKIVLFIAKLLFKQLTYQTIENNELQELENIIQNNE